MNVLRKLSFIFISFSLATLIDVILLDSKPDYYDGALPFDHQFLRPTNISAVTYITYLLNRDTDHVPQMF